MDDREIGEQIEILAERSEEIADLASKVQEQSEWDRNDKNNDLNWTVVRVEGTRNGMVYGEYIGNFDERQDALAFADGKDNWVAVPWGYGEKQEIGSEFEFVMGRSGEIDKIAKTMDRGKEVTEDLVVCKWDGRNGPPIIGNQASFDAGREFNGDARERLASSIGVSGETVEIEEFAATASIISTSSSWEEAEAFVAVGGDDADGIKASSALFFAVALTLAWNHAFG